MRRTEIDDLKERVGCGAVLESSGFAIDIKESTRRAVKYRRDAEIIIVTHYGKGWFDPLGDAKGDIFSLAERLYRVGFVEGFERVAGLVGFRSAEPVWRARPKRPPHDVSLPERWAARRRPWRGSSTWRYLCEQRFLPPAVVQAALAADLLREGPYGSMWAAHTDEGGVVEGWEERGPDWRGFASGGAKTLFRFGAPAALRLCVTEAAIDAMSLAAIEGIREGTLYLSTGGGWSSQTDAALQALASRTGALLVAATDANQQGESYAERLATLAEAASCDWQRLKPSADDWNEVLKERRKENEEKRRRKRRAASASAASRVKLRPAKPALDPTERDAGGSGGVMKD
jgi:hypothetical protein